MAEQEPHKDPADAVAGEQPKTGQIAGEEAQQQAAAHAAEPAPAAGVEVKPLPHGGTPPPPQPPAEPPSAAAPWPRRVVLTALALASIAAVIFVIYVGPTQLFQRVMGGSDFDLTQIAPG